MTRTPNRTHARSLNRFIGDRRVLPLRALPFVAPRTLCPGNVARALAEPDERGAIAGFSLKGEIGPIEARSPAEFLRSLHDIDVLDEANPLMAFIACLPPGIVTPYEQARRLHWEVLEHMIVLQMDQIADDTWEDAPALSADEQKLVFEGFPRAFVEQQAAFRTNSSTRNAKVIGIYVDELIRRARAHGVAIDPLRLPGTKAQLREALIEIATPERPIPRIANSTLVDYLAELGLRWQPGRPSADNPWLKFIKSPCAP